MSSIKRLLSTLPRLHSPTEEKPEINFTPATPAMAEQSPSSPFTRQSRSTSPIPFSDSALQVPRPAVALVPPPERIDILRYRQHNGVNLSGIFVLDKSLFPRMFLPEAKGETELDAVEAVIEKYGMKEAREMWDDHWRESMKVADWSWLKSTAKVTTVRIPIGFYTLGKDWCIGTEFEEVAEVYETAWKHLKHMTKVALDHKIGILLVLQAAPRGIGKESCPKAGAGATDDLSDSWCTPRNLSLTTRCLVYLASQILTSRTLHNSVIGIQIVDQPPPKFSGIWTWYTQVMQAINAVNPELPIYLNDGGDLLSAVEFVKTYINSGKPKTVGTVKNDKNPVFIEIRREYHNNELFGKLQPNKLLDLVNHGLDTVPSNAGFIVGEWGSTLSTNTTNEINISAGTDSLEKFKKTFTKLQMETYLAHPGCAGQFFYTYKMDRMPGHPDGFRAAFVEGLVPLGPSWYYLPSPHVRALAREVNKELLDLEEADPHSIYGQALSVAFRDATSFFEFRSESGIGADFVGPGAEALWARKRWEDYIRAGGSGNQEEFVLGILAGLATWKKEMIKRIDELPEYAWKAAPDPSASPDSAADGMIF